ncbi:MAG TPA: HAMP domain-containing methyl-accepting chemotaxis protein, partial [Patescibacteria group bacterium]|nr:HAMP domain-containing methyl-accepting chemotaxis protein [Patescibacteria group bacterium]
NDEIGTLGASFNTMIGNIKSSREEILARQEYLSSHIEEILQAMEKFAEGNLNVQLNVRSEDEIGRLFYGFNTAVGKMRSTIQSVVTTVNQTATSSMQINSATEQLSASAQEQSAQSTQVAAAVEEMAQTSLENTRTAQHASELAKQYKATAHEGEAIIQQTVGKIREIADVVHQSVGTIEKLGESSSQIGEIVSVINDIADQTNLLALNAAIEAARAGEQGRGFAVVADEVRKLAERTSKATKEIAQMIKGIQSEANLAVSSMKKGSSEVAQGIVLADKAGNALAQIMTTSEETMQIISQIASASQEQSLTSTEVSKNVEVISEVSNQSAAGIQEIASAADNLNNLMNSLLDLTNRFDITDESHLDSRGYVLGTAYKRQRLALSN